MDTNTAQISEKLRQQFDFGPYPRIPIEKSPKEDANKLFIHNMVTPYYLRNQEVISTQGKTILDAGCGSGYKSLVLAEANPGAEIVGVDLSSESVKLAQERLKYHGFENAEFHAMAIEDLPSLGKTFDYINCDETLYFFPDPAIGLEAMKSVLKPKGLIRTNLHSAWQRAPFFRAQTMFQMMGLFENNPEELEVELVQEIMKSLKPQVDLRQRTWKPRYEQDNAQEVILANFLLQGDRGFKIPDMFAALRAASLEFTSMVNWHDWEILSLFNEPEDLPFFLAMSLPEISVEDRLTLFELIQPIHRLLDFWCGLPEAVAAVPPVSAWGPADWQGVQVHLHPQLQTPKARDAFVDSINNQQPLNLRPLLSASTGREVFVDTITLACLLLLMDGPLPLERFADRWRQLHPIHPITLEPLTTECAQVAVQKILMDLEVHLYVLLDYQGKSA
jgi:2-polyprenyl-3-methyl-5-hydroxy-6-metoxy-1,4-benzoquinol methylase